MIRAPACRIAIEAAGLGDIHLTTDDRLDPGLLRRVIKPDRPEEIAVIGNRHGRHFVLRGGFRKSVVVAGTVEETETGMKMQMNEVRHKKDSTATRCFCASCAFCG